MSQFTKIAIMTAFLKLLNKSPLNKISVKDIVDECGINRSTFYYHFEDIHSLLVEILQLETEKILDIKDSDFSWKDAFIQSTSFARENKKAIYHIYHSLNREYLDKYLYSVIGHYLEVVIKRELKDYMIKDSDINIMIDIYKFALVGMIYTWLESGMAKDYDEIASRMYELIGDNIKTTLIKTDPNYVVTTTIEKKHSDK